MALDSGTLFARMPQKSPPAEDGWNMFLVWGNGATNISPAQLIIRANGDDAWFGWSNSLQVETEVAAWYDAKTLAEEKAAVRRLNRAAFDHVVYAPLGFFQLYQAWRKSVTGIVPSPLAFFWR